MQIGPAAPYCELGSGKTLMAPRAASSDQSRQYSCSRNMHQPVTDRVCDEFGSIAAIQRSADSRAVSGDSVHADVERTSEFFG